MTLRILPASVVGDLRRLEPLATKIFGNGDRPEGWFARKLHRECVDPALSRLAVEGDAEDPRSWRGYVLVGAPSSVLPAARTSGTGVVPEARGRGIGHQLIRETFAAVLRGGFAALQVPADPERASFYLRLGFEPIRNEVTLLTFGTGKSDPSWGINAPWSLRRERVLGEWLREAWMRGDTQSQTEVTVRGPQARLRALVSREGRACVAHRVLLSGETLTEDEVLDLLDGLRAQFAEGSPLLLLGFPSYLSLVGRLVEDGWSVAQSSQIMERRIEDGGVR